MLTKEALRKKIDKTPAYRDSVDDYRNGVVFGAFVQRVIDQEIRLDNTAVRRYYDEHGAEFLSPAMIRLNDLAFERRDEAADALEKLRRGADFKWVKANAPGQIVEKDRKGLAPLGGEFFAEKDLPDGVREAISGAGPGEFRLYTSPESQFFVLCILEVIPSKPYPYEEVKNVIWNRLFQEERKKSAEGWVEKLRAASESRSSSRKRSWRSCSAIPAAGPPNHSHQRGNSGRAHEDLSKEADLGRSGHVHPLCGVMFFVSRDASWAQRKFERKECLDCHKKFAEKYLCDEIGPCLS